MSREHKYQAIILKKQPFNEGDEIITFFSLENGKIRGLAKSVKLAKSRLRHALQTLFLVNIRLTASKGMPKIISAEVVKSFSGIRENLPAAAGAFYAIELLLKFTADEQKNEKLFNLLLDFLSFLDDYPAEDPGLALVKFKTELLSAVGLSVTFHDDLAKQADKLRQCQILEQTAYKNLASLKNFGEINLLQEFLSNFIVFHLERQVNSEIFLKNVI